MRKILLVLIGLFLIPILNAAWATTELDTLGNPDITLSTNSGPPGTNITIKISHIPNIANESYPYPALYIYLPFSQPFGTSLQSHCGTQDCFPVYTHNDAVNQNFANRTIVFSLPSTNNPEPVLLNGFENTICDIVLDGKTVERFSTLCNTKNEPPGIYQIKLAWVLESDSGQSYTVKTIPFTVTPALLVSSPSVADNGDVILKKYQNGTINLQQFYEELKSRNWTDEQIRQALGVLGKLPHQMGFLGPDNKLPVFQTNSSNVRNNTSSVANLTTQKTPTMQKTNPIIQSNDSALVHKTENQTNSTVSIKNNTATLLPKQNDPMLNYIIIGLSVAAAMIVLTAVILAKLMRKIKK